MSGRQAEAGPQRPADPRLGPGGVRRRSRRADHRGGQARGVGISALFTRYASKEELLRKLCTDGLLIVVNETRPPSSASKEGGDHGRSSPISWAAGRRGHQLDDPRLAGKFAPTRRCSPWPTGQAARWWSLRPDPRRAQAGPGAARRLAGIRAGGRDQVRRPRAHRRGAAPVPGAPSSTACGPRYAASCPARRRPGRKPASAGTPAEPRARPRAN